MFKKWPVIVSFDIFDFKHEQSLRLSNGAQFPLNSPVFVKGCTILYLQQVYSIGHRLRLFLPRFPVRFWSGRANFYILGELRLLYRPHHCFFPLGDTFGAFFSMRLFSVRFEHDLFVGWNSTFSSESNTVPHSGDRTVHDPFTHDSHSLKRNRFKGPFYSQPYLQGIPAYRYNFAFFLFSRICRCRRNATTFFPLFICLISGCHHQLAPLSSPHLSANFWKLDVAAKYQRARFFRLWTFSQTQLTMEVNPMEVKHNSQKVLETLQYSWPVTPFDSFSCKTCLGTKSSLTLHDFTL